jgi:hypothetical protein
LCCKIKKTPGLKTRRSFKTTLFIFAAVVVRVLIWPLLSAATPWRPVAIVVLSLSSGSCGLPVWIIIPLVTTGILRAVWLITSAGLRITSALLLLVSGTTVILITTLLVGAAAILLIPVLTLLLISASALSTGSFGPASSWLIRASFLVSSFTACFFQAF